LLREGAGAGGSRRPVREFGFDPVDHIAREPQQDRRNAQANVRIESGVLGRDKGLTEEGRDVVVADDEAPLDGEIANQFAIAGIDARDRVRVVVIERGNFRQVARVREEHATQRAEHRGDDEEGDDAGALGETNDVGSQCS